MAELGVEVVERNGVQPRDFRDALADLIPCCGSDSGTGEGVDDLALLGPASGDLIANAFCTLARGGMLTLSATNHCRSGRPSTPWAALRPHDHHRHHQP